MPDLLIELFSEEIPARMQTRAADDLKSRVTDGLVEAGLTYAGAAAFSTPRRLTLALEGLTASSPTTREERKGPRTDAPEKAIEGFLRGAGVSRDDLEVRDEKKGRSIMPRSPSRAVMRVRSSPMSWRVSFAASRGRNPCDGATARCAGCGPCTRSCAS